MYTFFVMLNDTLLTGQLFFYMFFFAYVWIRFAVVIVHSRRYRPFVSDAYQRADVIIPVVDEPVEVFRHTLRTVSESDAAAIIVVINGPRNPALEEVCSEFPRVHMVWTPRAGKRNAIVEGLAFVTAELTVLVDSDTFWTPTTLPELLKPFAEPEVGGVTTRQKIADDRASLLSLFCAMMEDIRAEGSLKAMSVHGTVGCLPGRTIAFRTHILRESAQAFLTERFMGIHKEVSDDRSLTNLTLRSGFSTVLQDTSVVFTQAPNSWRQFVRQQLRWAEGSQYNNLRMWGWMFRHARLSAYLYLTDMLTPFLVLAVGAVIVVKLLVNSTHNVSFGTTSVFFVVAIIILSAAAGIGIRQIVPLAKKPIFIIYLPFFVVILTVLLVPIRVLGFARCADDLGWGTRRFAYEGAGGMDGAGDRQQLGGPMLRAAVAGDEGFVQDGTGA